MDFAFTTSQEAFRRQVAAFVVNVFPEGPPERNAATTGRWEAALIARGWQAYKWQPQYGGPAWSATEKYLWEIEVGRFGLPTQISGSGVSMIGPILCGFGTDDQRARYLPGMLDGSEQWCQGYSEPGAGSDLASLRTRAQRAGDLYVVDGEKIWTSGAHASQRMFALVRTSATGRKQQGITFLLIDMADPGVVVTPIFSIDGHHSLNRVALTDVRVPVTDRIGAENDGWSIAKGLLTHERTGLAFVTESLRKLAVLKTAVAASMLLEDACFAHKIADVDTELQSLVVTELRALSESADGSAPGVYSSILKLKGTGIVQRLTELLLESAGYHGMPYPLTPAGEVPDERIGPRFCQEEVAQYLIGRSASIAGGSDVVQRNIIAKQVLGL